MFYSQSRSSIHVFRDSTDTQLGIIETKKKRLVFTALPNVPMTAKDLSAVASKLRRLAEKQ